MLPGVAAVQVDHGGALAVVAHPVHQLPHGRPRAGREGVPGVPQVVKANAGEAGRRERGEPPAAAEVAVPQRQACRTGEYQAIVPVCCEAAEMPLDDRADDLRGG
jgi:hypothetical protein